MNKYVIIPDSFKGTMSSKEICQIVSTQFRLLDPDAEIHQIPVADGGEGTVNSFLTAIGGKKIEAECKGPYMENIRGFYGLLPDGTAVVEMAAAAGLLLVGNKLNPELTTTYGVGQLIGHAADNGAKQIILALGGSATNDGGCGAAAALGVDFFDKSGKKFIPVGGTLKDIGSISIDNIKEELRYIPFTTMCDIDNTLCGKHGASAIFGPQKGADIFMIQRLDEGLKHMAAVIRRDLLVDVLDTKGGGAAGGFGAGSIAFFNSTLRMGIDIVLDLTEFDTIIKGAKLIITGEGKLDSQSLGGKVVIGVARRAKKAGIPVVALVGSSEINISEAYSEGVTGIFPINPLLGEYEEVKEHCRENLAFTAYNILNFVQGMTND